MKTARHCLAMIVFAFAAPSASAEPLAELKALLQRFNGREPLSATVDIHSVSHGGEEKKGKSRQSQSRVLVEDGPQGLKLGWTQQQLQLARREARARFADRDAPTPNLDALTALSARDAARLLDFADELDAQLAGAELLEARDDVWQGQPARLLRVKLPLRLGPEEQKMMKSFEQSLHIWLNAEGAPIAIERSQSYKASKFLISFEGGEKETVNLGRIGNRLVVLNSRKENSGSGFGYASTGSVTIAVKFQ